MYALEDSTGKPIDYKAVQFGTGATAAALAAALSKQRQGERDFQNTIVNPSFVAENVAAIPPDVDWSSYPDVNQYKYTGPTGEQMATKEFGPQFEALKTILGNAQTRYNTGKTDITSMYDQLAKYVTGKKTTTGKEYDATGKALTSGYEGSMNKAGQTYSDAASKVAQMLAKLGLGQSSNYVADQASSKLAQQLGYITGDQTARTGFNTQQKQNELDFLTNTSNNAKLAGNNRVSDLTSQFQDIQYQSELKRLGLMSDEQAAANKYNQSIQESIDKNQQNSIDNWFKKQDLKLGWDKEDVAKAGQELDLKKFNTDVDQFNTTNQQKQSSDQLKQLDNDVYSKLAYYAGNVYNGNNSNANNAVNTIINTYRDDMSNDALPSLAKFLQKLTEKTSDPGEQQRLQQLGTIWWQSVGNKPAYGGLA